MRRLLPAALGLFLATAPVLAQPVKDPAKIEAGRFTVDPDHTQVLFGADHFGFTTYFGHFSQVSGWLALSPRSPSDSRFEISLPADSVATTSATLDGELKGADWLDAETYPTILFRSRSVEQTGPDTAKVVGDLTLHGITHPVTLAVHLNGAGINPLFEVYTIGFQATGTLRRSDFGVKPYLPAIGDEIELIISAAFVKA